MAPEQREGVRIEMLGSPRPPTQPAAELPAAASGSGLLPRAIMDAPPAALGTAAQEEPPKTEEPQRADAPKKGVKRCVNDMTRSFSEALASHASEKSAENKGKGAKDKKHEKHEKDEKRETGKRPKPPTEDGVGVAFLGGFVFRRSRQKEWRVYIPKEHSKSGKAVDGTRKFGADEAASFQGALDRIQAASK